MQLTGKTRRINTNTCVRSMLQEVKGKYHDARKFIIILRKAIEPGCKIKTILVAQRSFSAYSDLGGLLFCSLSG